MKLIFPEWLPDQPPHLSKGLLTCSGVYPAANGYRPVGVFSALKSALTDECRGAASFVTTEGSSLIIAGTYGRLMVVQGGDWTTLGSGFAGQGGSRWRFAQFGSLAIATNEADPIQSVNLSTFALADLDGSPPRMRLLAVVKDFLAGAVVDGDVLKVQWSGINDATWWTVGQRQSDYQVMPTGGEITGLIGGEFGLVLQRNRITRMDYVGGNVIFAFNEISTNIGCVSIHSVVQSGRRAFWRADNGFIMWDGASLKPIGNERVDRYFDSLYTVSDWEDASVAVDAKNNLVGWSMGDRIFIYNWVLDRWSVIPVEAEIIFGGYSLGTSLDDLDGIYGNLDAVPISLDDPSLEGGSPLFYVFDNLHRLGVLSGESMAAELGFGDLELAMGRNTRLKRCRPLTDAVSGMTLTVGSKQRLGDALSETEYTLMGPTGHFSIRENGRFIRPSLAFEQGAEWDYAQGLEFEGVRGARQ